MKNESWHRALSWLNTPSKLDELKNELGSKSVEAIKAHALNLISKIDSVDIIKNEKNYIRFYMDMRIKTENYAPLPRSRMNLKA